MDVVFEVIKRVIKRLGESPTRAEALSQTRAEACDRLHQLLDRQNAIEVMVAGEVAAERGADGKPSFPNEALRRAEEYRRLSTSIEYQQVLQEVDRARRELRALDAEIESVQRRHASDLAVVGLVTVLLNAGKSEEVEEILAAYTGGQAEAATPAEQAASPVADPTSETPEEVTVIVLETRAAKSEGVVRAWCRLADGSYTAVFGKNGIGQTLAAAAGKAVKVRGKQGNAGLIALRVDPV